MSDDKMKRSDQIRQLQVCAKYTDTGEWEGLFTYPNCGPDLVRTGLATEDKKITTAGRAALWLAGQGPDPTADSKSFYEVRIPLKNKNTEGDPTDDRS